MRIQGRLIEWNDEQGHGFITPLGGEERLIVHVTDFPAEDRRPILNDLVTYEASVDDRGRPRAVSVEHLTPCAKAACAPSGTSAPGVPASVAPATDVDQEPRQLLISPRMIAIGALVVVMGLCSFSLWLGSNLRPSPAGPASSELEQAVASVPGSGDDALASAFSNRASGIQVSGQGTVTRVLADDNDGSRHQRFILKLASGQTLLVAHNIDIAPRLPGPVLGDTVSFNGEYEWNDKGGVIHWTHHDPDGSHTAGWLEYNGQRYQ